MLCKLVYGNEFEIESYAPRQYRLRQLLRFGGCEYEYHVRRRFFERFEQRVESAARKHVRLVDYIHFVFSDDRHVLDFFANVARVVDAVVGRRVQLDYVDVLGRRQSFTRLALAARTAVYGVQAVDRTREYARARRFAYAAAARE